MIYLPDDWIVNKKNESYIKKILDKLDTDLKFENSLTQEEASKQLEEIGEIIIIEKINDGSIVFGA